MRRWSKLQKELYLIIDPRIDFQLHCSAYHMQSQKGSTNLPRYWITLGNTIIFDYPKDYLNNILPREGGRCLNSGTSKWLLAKDFTVKELYPYYTEVQDISTIIREYIDTPVTELFEKKFEYDFWELTDILKAADKRIGKRRLLQMKSLSGNEAVKKVITARL